MRTEQDCGMRIRIHKQPVHMKSNIWGENISAGLDEQPQAVFKKLQEYRDVAGAWQAWDTVNAFKIRSARGPFIISDTL